MVAGGLLPVYNGLPGWSECGGGSNGGELPSTLSRYVAVGGGLLAMGAGRPGEERRREGGEMEMASAGWGTRQVLNWPVSTGGFFFEFEMRCSACLLPMSSCLLGKCHYWLGTTTRVCRRRRSRDVRVRPTPTPSRPIFPTSCGLHL
jgi:hypothetical protein